MSERTACCEAPFLGIGWPECDLCSACKEHAEPMELELEIEEQVVPVSRETAKVRFAAMRDVVGRR